MQEIMELTWMFVLPTTQGCDLALSHCTSDVDSEETLCRAAQSNISFTCGFIHLIWPLTPKGSFGRWKQVFAEFCQYRDAGLLGNLTVVELAQVL